MKYWPTKSPASVADYQFDWSRALQDGEAIASHDIIAEGVTVDSDTASASAVTVWLSGGAEGTVARVTCAITTDSNPARTFSEVAVLPLGDCAVSLREAKQALKIEHDNDDDLIRPLLAASADQVERLTGKVLTPRVVSQAEAGFPNGTGVRGTIRLFRAPVREVIEIAYDDGDGAEQLLADYRLSEGVPATIAPLVGASFPAALAAPASVRISYLAGYAPGEMPAALKGAVLLKLRQLYDGPDGREDKHGDPAGFAGLLQAHRAVGIS